MPQLLDLPMEVPMLLGFSGGADSTALVRLMMERYGREGLYCVHVHHGLRGEEADGDEAFVRDFCGTWGLRLFIRHLNLKAGTGEGPARKARYAAFREVMAESGSRVLVLAHHRGDQAETVLLHMLRGSGVRGLCGMKSVDEVEGMRIIRPLLASDPEELRAWLREKGQVWREDGSNGEDLYLRNRIRHGLLPEMESLSPGVRERLWDLSLSCREEHEALEELARGILKESLDQPLLPLSCLEGQPEGLRNVCLRLWWEHRGHGGSERSLSREATLRLKNLLSKGAGASENLPGGCRIYRGWKYLHDLDAGEVREERVPLPVRSCGRETGDGRRCQAFPPGLLDACEIRTRRGGDWIRPFGSPGRQSLKEYLISRHVDAPFRSRIPLVCRGAEVLMVSGVGAGDIPAKPDGAEWEILRWEGRMPWMTEE